MGYDTTSTMILLTFLARFLLSTFELPDLGEDIFLRSFADLEFPFFFESLILAGSSLSVMATAPYNCKIRE